MRAIYLHLREHLRRGQRSSIVRHGLLWALAWGMGWLSRVTESVRPRRGVEKDLGAHSARSVSKDTSRFTTGSRGPWPRQSQSIRLRDSWRFRGRNALVAFLLMTARASIVHPKIADQIRPETCVLAGGWCEAQSVGTRCCLYNLHSPRKIHCGCARICPSVSAQRPHEAADSCRECKLSRSTAS